MAWQTGRTGAGHSGVSQHHLGHQVQGDFLEEETSRDVSSAGRLAISRRIAPTNPHPLRYQMPVL